MLSPRATGILFLRKIYAIAGISARFEPRFQIHGFVEMATIPLQPISSSVLRFSIDPYPAYFPSNTHENTLYPFLLAYQISPLLLCLVSADVQEVS